MDLNTIWFILVGVLFTGYAMLDGFDLGVGALHLFVKKDEDRRIFLNAIGPVWDGNEVWLVTGGGALFAAFPGVYATVFSGFYLAFMALLAALIFRAVAIEFRSKEQWHWWRTMWDTGFSLGSIVSGLLIGVAMGNILQGIPLDARGNYTGGFFHLLNPYALLLGLTTVALFAMHGSIYLVMKTEGNLQARVRTWVGRTIAVFLFFYIALNIATLFYAPHLLEKLRDRPWLLAVFALNVLAVMNIPRENRNGNEFRAFLSSCAAMALLMALFGLTVYPDMVLSMPDPQNSLTIYNAASTPKTHTIMLVIAVIGVPVVLAYTASVYYIFRGKVKLTPHSY
ncbi:MAG: cytochrome d ubiquinol oxidase subunit II [Chthoniobacterales bacterium]|nr:cytochrome d ubiquinol oxidase subunit II [Chthoniobacterales bacterium]